MHADHDNGQTKMTGTQRQRKSISLRTHFRVYMSAMLLLLGVLGTTSYVSLQTTINLFEAVTEREFTEMRRLAYLQDMTRVAAQPIHHYVAWGDPDEAPLFEQVVAEVDQAYLDVLVLASLKQRQRSLVLKAQREWELAVVTGREILNKPFSMDTGYMKSASKAFEDHVTRSIDTLYQAHNIRIMAIEDHRQTVTEGFHVSRSMTVAGFVMAVAILIVASITLARYILGPLGILKDSIDRFARGELSHRVPLVATNELGDLARGFNNMADRLEQDQIELEQMAIRDGLTELYNRREFERLLSEELQRSQRYQHAVSLLMVDIDKFKDINDTHGHRAGDDALHVVASVIRDVSRNGDVVARYGGEEIAVILPETSGADAFAMAERIRNSVANQPIMLKNGKMTELTVSVGVATFPDDATTQGKLVDTTDQAMYLAKAAGRNCVRRPDSPENDPPVAMS